jgi:hypothetical protein
MPTRVVADAEGVFVHIESGGEGQGDGRFTLIIYPTGVAVVSEQDNQRIQVFSKSDGAFVRKWGIKGEVLGQLEPVSKWRGSRLGTHIYVIL